MALAKVDYFDIRYDHRNKSPVLFLKDAQRDKYLPIWMGELEANSIEFAEMGKASPRPQTHDLLMNVLGIVGARVLRVYIDRLESRTYFAKLFIEINGKAHELDCRPSDGIAMALRAGAQIFVDEHLMYLIKFEEVEQPTDEPELEDPLEPEDPLKY